MVSLATGWSYCWTNNAGMMDQGMQRGLVPTLARKLGILVLTAATCAAAPPVVAQGVEIYSDEDWSSLPGQAVATPRTPTGDRRATRPPTTIVIPDGSLPVRSATVQAPPQPPRNRQDGVPPPDVDPTGRWGASPAAGPVTSAGRAHIAPAPLALPESRVIGGPRARRSGLGIEERTNRPPSYETRAPERATLPLTAPITPPHAQRSSAPQPAQVQRPAVASRVMPDPAPPSVPDRQPLSTLPGAALGGGNQGLGPGDAVRVTVFGQPDLETQTVVGDDGSITLPLVDRVVVGGLSPQAAGNRIADAYAEGEYLKNPQVNLTVEAIRSRQISVLGAVASPGRFPLESETSVLDALAMAGGITEQGARTVTLVRRQAGGAQQRYNLRLDELLSGTGAIGFNVAGGDTIYVPEAQKFYIYGEVRRPDAYPLHEPITVMQAISVGGGLTERGSETRVQLRRSDEQGRTRTRSVDLTDFVQPDDVIFVKERLF